MKIRTWKVPPRPIKNVLPFLRVTLPNTPSGDPNWTATEVVRKHDELGLPPGESVVVLQNWGGGGGYHGDPHRLKYRETLCDMAAWNVGYPDRDEEAVDFWKTWTEKFVGKLDALDYDPAGFTFDCERNTDEHAERLYPQMDKAFYSLARESWSFR